MSYHFTRIFPCSHPSTYSPSQGTKSANQTIMFGPLEIPEPPRDIQIEQCSQTSVCGMLLFENTCHYYFNGAIIAREYHAVRWIEAASRFFLLFVPNRRWAGKIPPKSQKAQRNRIMVMMMMGRWWWAPGKKYRYRPLLVEPFCDGIFLRGGWVFTIQ